MDMQYNIDIQKSLLQNVCISGLFLKNSQVKVVYCIIFMFL